MCDFPILLSNGMESNWIERFRDKLDINQEKLDTFWQLLIILFMNYLHFAWDFVASENNDIQLIFGQSYYQKLLLWGYCF